MCGGMNRLGGMIQILHTSSPEMQRYLSKISGPLLDWIDFTNVVPKIIDKGAST
jgi:predicted ATPase with chaperone activity